jgi:hypothetical protein
MAKSTKAVSGPIEATEFGRNAAELHCRFVGNSRTPNFSFRSKVFGAILGEGASL